MWKKFAPLIIILILIVVGVGVWLSMQKVVVQRNRQIPSSTSGVPQAAPAEAGGGGIVPHVPPAPVTSETPVPNNIPVIEKEGGKKQIVPTTQPVPVPAGGPAEGRVISPASSAVPTSAPELAGHHQVQYDGQTFSPKILTIKKGDTVVFVNSGKNPMWVASAMHPTHGVYPTTGGCIGSTFDACKGYEAGSSWSFTFDYVGSWGYHDHLNAGAFGKIVVQK